MRKRAAGPARPALQLLLAVAAAGGLQFLAPLATVDPGRELHGDEALYMYWGQRMARFDDWFLRRGSPDKPPLLPAAMGAAFKAGGVSRGTAALPNRLMGVLGAAAVFGLGTAVGGAAAGWFSLLLLGLSGGWQFHSFSLFTDAGLAALTACAVWACVTGRWGAAGACSALAAGFKQFGLFAILGVLSAAFFAGSAGRGSRLRRLLRGLVLAGLPLAVWETAVRPVWGAFRPSTVGTGGGFPWSELPERLGFWTGTLLDSVSLTPAILVVFLLLPAFAGKIPRAVRWLAAATAGWLAVLSLSGVSRFPRYTVFVLPLLCVLLGFGMSRLRELVSRVTRLGATAAGIVLAASLAWLAVAEWSRAPFRTPESGPPALAEVLTRAVAEGRPPARLLLPDRISWAYQNVSLFQPYVSCGRDHDGAAGDIAAEEAAFPDRPLVILARRGTAGSSCGFNAWREAAAPPLERVYARTDGGRVLYELFRLPPRREPDWELREGGLAGGGGEFACGLRLLGGKVVRREGAGDLVLGWECVRTPRLDYLSNVRCRDGRGKTLFKLDHEIARGVRPVSRWRPGDRVRDAVAGPSLRDWRKVAAIEVSLYDFQSARSAPLAGGKRGGRVRLDGPAVKGGIRAGGVVAAPAEGADNIAPWK